MEIGMGIPFVQLIFVKFGTWTTKTWLKTMWKNRGSLEIELILRDLPYLLLQREGCTCIMTEFDGLYDIDKRTIRRLNRVRLSMEIYVMSDLATGNGLRIWQDIVAACTPEMEEQSQYK